MPRGHGACKQFREAIRPLKEGFSMKQEQLTELLYQALETETGGIQVYRTAIRCAQNDELKEEWQKYLEQTENHERILQDVCTSFGLDPAKETPGRLVVRHIGQSLVKAMELALQSGPPEAAELVAAECWSTPRRRTT